MIKYFIALLALVLGLNITFSNTTVFAASSLSADMVGYINKAVPNANQKRYHNLSSSEWQTVRTSFISKLESFANRINAKPDSLLALMLYETSGTLDPAIDNGLPPLNSRGASSNPSKSQSPSELSTVFGCVGLIQFCKGSGLVEVAQRSPLCTASSIKKITIDKQFDCVETYFSVNKRSSNSDLATLYSVINWPAGQNYGPNDPWYCENKTVVVNGTTYSGSIFSRQDSVAQSNAETIGGARCITKSAYAKTIVSKVQAWVGNGFNDASVLPGNPNASTVDLGTDRSWMIKAVTLAQIEIAERDLLKQQNDAVNNAVSNTLALPSSFFGGCSLRGTQQSSIPAVTGESLTTCLKSILNFVFIAAILVLIISLSSTNIGIILSSGETGSGPVRNARNKLEKGLIGIFLIGAPYLLLDIFSGGLSSFQLTALERTQSITPFSVITGSGLPDSYAKEFTAIQFDGELDALLGNEGFNGTSNGTSDLVEDSNNREGGSEESQVAKLCGDISTSGKSSENANCKVLNVQYAHQIFNKSGGRTPVGTTACGAASAVMIANFLQPGLFDFSSTNNIGGLGLRDNVFTASTYLRATAASRGVKAMCTRASGVPVSGAWSFTGKNQTECSYNLGPGINTYLSLYNLGVKNISYSYSAPQGFFNSVRAAIDRGNPVIVYGTTVFGHVAVIKGYVKDQPNKFIMNDPWGDGFDGSSRGANERNKSAGNGIIYNFDQRISKEFESRTWYDTSANEVIRK